jgi:hypothetical protein
MTTAVAAAMNDVNIPPVDDTQAFEMQLAEPEQAAVNVPGQQEFLDHDIVTSTNATALS